MKEATYTVRQVEFEDHEDEINRLQDTCGLSRSPYEETVWWLAFFGDAPVAYLGVIESPWYPGKVYFIRTGVQKKHRGNGLQLRMMQAMERWAKTKGYTEILSDTTDTIYSANNFIRCGYEIFDPKRPWAFKNTIYWRKKL